MGLSVITGIFLIFGIDVRDRSTTRFHPKLMWAYEQIIATFWLLKLLHTLGSIIWVLVEDQENLWISLTSAATQIFVCMTWFYLRSRKVIISGILKNVARMIAMHQVMFPSLFIKLTAVLVIVFPLTENLAYAKGAKKKLLNKFYFGIFDGSSNRDALLLIAMAAKLCKTAFITWFVSFYSAMCVYGTKLLQAHVERNNRLLLDGYFSINFIVVDSAFGRHREIINLMDRIESLMSFPVFLVHVTSFFELLHNIILLDETGTKPIGNVMMFVFLHASFSFFSVTTSAAWVPEWDEKANESDSTLIKRAVRSGYSAHMKKVLSCSHRVTRPPFSFSAWNVFSFTKGYILAAVGNILTYSLLIKDFINNSGTQNSTEKTTPKMENLQT